MSKQKHTPWRSYRLTIDETAILDSNLKTIARGMEADTANEILKAVNNHDRLVEVLEWIVDSENDNDLHNAIDKGIELLTELKS